MSETSKPVTQSRRTLYVLIGLFFLPLAAAFILYYGMGWRPAGGTNHGELLKQVNQLPEDAAPLLGKWALVYVGDGRCDEACQRSLVMARQTRLALNKDMTRIERALLATSECCNLDYVDREHQGLKVFDVSDPAGRDELLGLLPAGDLSNFLFIVDPNGNIVMRFDTREKPRGLFEDLKKLLKLSHIG